MSIFTNSADAVPQIHNWIKLLNVINDKPLQSVKS